MELFGYTFTILQVVLMAIIATFAPNCLRNWFIKLGCLVTNSKVNQAWYGGLIDCAWVVLIVILFGTFN